MLLQHKSLWPGRRQQHQHAASVRPVACRAMAKAQPTERAVVIGSGMSGLAVSQALSKHFKHVVVLERNEMKPVWQLSAVDMVKEKNSRTGVGQYHMLHALAGGGLRALDKIFDNGQYSAALEAAGAKICNAYTAIRTIHPQVGVYAPNTSAKEQLKVALASRHVFETTARQLVAENDRISFQYGAAVSGLLFDSTAETNGKPAGAAVTGVQLADGSCLSAAVVVDCSGRLSSLPRWLEGAGLQAPRVTTASAGCGYASWFVRMSPEAEAALEDIDGLYTLAQPPELSMALMLRIEHDQWVVSVGGYQGLYPPQDDGQMVTWTQANVWHPVVGQLLQNSIQLAPAGRFYNVGSTWRHYEEVALPERLIVMADSICSFNPIYGQGMTVAALQALQLSDLLESRRQSADSALHAHPTPCQPSTLAGSSSALESEPAQVDLTGLSAEFQAAVLPLVQQAWDAAAGTDIRYGGQMTGQAPAATGPLQQALASFSRNYTSTVFELAAVDPQVSEAMSRVFQMVESPAHLMQPSVLFKVLMRQLQQKVKSIAFGWRDAASSGTSSAGADGASEGTGVAAASSISPARARVLSGDERYNVGLRWTTARQMPVTAVSGVANT